MPIQETPPPPPAAAGGPPRSGGNKKVIIWVVVGVVTVLVICCGGFGALVFGAFGMIKKSEVYQTAVPFAISNQKVIDALGEPIESGFAAGGNVNLNGSNGDAMITTTLTGSKGTGTLVIEATKTGGIWTYDSIVVTVLADGSTIELQNEPGAP